MSLAGRRAVTHCQEHTDVPAAWERHVHRASHVATKQPGLESSRLRCLGCPSTDGVSTSTIHDNQPAEAGNRHWVRQTVAAFYRSLHWSVAFRAVFDGGQGGLTSPRKRYSWPPRKFCITSLGVDSNLPKTPQASPDSIFLLNQYNYVTNSATFFREIIPISGNWHHRLEWVVPQHGKQIEHLVLDATDQWSDR